MRAMFIQVVSVLVVLLLAGSGGGTFQKQQDHSTKPIADVDGFTSRI
jgi:hypothetical protein